MGNENNPVKNCQNCGKQFHTSRTGKTVNCPSCRGGSSSSGPKQPGVKQMAAKPRDMRYHLYQDHGTYSPSQLDATEDLDVAHKEAHDAEWQRQVVPHTHRDLFNDRRK